MSLAVFALVMQHSDSKLTVKSTSQSTGSTSGCQFIPASSIISSPKGLESIATGDLTFDACFQKCAANVILFIQISG